MTQTKDDKYLAIGRSNGQIEFWETASWTMIYRIPGIKMLDIRRLHFLEPDFRQSINLFEFKSKQDTLETRTLISTGINGLVVEWNLSSLQISR